MIYYSHRSNPHEVKAKIQKQVQMKLWTLWSSFPLFEVPISFYSIKEPQQKNIYIAIFTKVFLSIQVAAQ